MFLVLRPLHLLPHLPNPSHSLVHISRYESVTCKKVLYALPKFPCTSWNRITETRRPLFRYSYT